MAASDVPELNGDLKEVLDSDDLPNDGFKEPGDRASIVKPEDKRVTTQKLGPEDTRPNMGSPTHGGNGH